MDRSSVNVLSLCTGIGGLDRGVRLEIPSARAVCCVEVEAYCCEVLATRMEEGHVDAAPIWTDLRTFDGRPWRGVVDLVVGGYPCQPFSYAGSRLGADDPRHLWPHIARILRECDAPAAFFENVRGHVSLGLREVRAELEDMGYRVDAEICQASEVGTSQRRERVFILAYSDAERCTWLPRSGRQALHGTEHVGEAVGSAASAGRERSGLHVSAGHAQDHSRLGGTGHPVGDAAPWPPGPDDADGWNSYLEQWPDAEPSVCRSTDGIPDRVDRLRALGGAVVDQQAAFALRLMRDRVAAKVKAA